MRTRTLLALTLLSCLGLPHCSDDDDGARGQGGAAGGQSGGGSECTASSATCECIELVPGGLRVCKRAPEEATACPNGSREPLDQCCTSADCTTGKCFAEPLTTVCSGAAQPRNNVCGVDQCTAEAGCSGGAFCLPAGVLGNKVAVCVSGCRRDADCAEKPGGRCVIEPTTRCCNDARPRCRYPDTPLLGDECPP